MKRDVRSGMNIPSVKSNFETYVILIASITVMYAFAVWKLHAQDSHRIPFLSQMMPTIERTTEGDSITLFEQELQDPNSQCGAYLGGWWHIGVRTTILRDLEITDTRREWQAFPLEKWRTLTVYMKYACEMSMTRVRFGFSVSELWEWTHFCWPIPPAAELEIRNRITQSAIIEEWKEI